MKKRIIGISLSIMLILSFCISIVGCGNKVSEETAVSLVKTLVNESYFLNVAYFGNGLEYLEEDIEENNLYAPVSPSESCTTKKQLVEKTRKIFSSSYASSMIETAFNGVKDATGTSAIYARYMVYDGDRLYVYREIEGIEINKYDFSKIEITKISGSFIQANMFTEKGDTVNITVINENGEWRLDSATY
ncbi:MAG: hypothetical protein J6B34_01935 [Clostridia bacterium]|nr:hypothetical protein [Clostridia bacterium]